MGWPVTRLFQEYGSATSRPGVGGTGFSSICAVSLGSEQRENRNIGLKTVLTKKTLFVLLHGMITLRYLF